MLGVFAVQTALVGLLINAAHPARTSQVYFVGGVLHAALTTLLVGLAIYARVHQARLENFLSRLRNTARAAGWLNAFFLACLSLSAALILGASLLEGYAQSFPSSTAAGLAGWLPLSCLGFAAIAFEAGIWTAHFLSCDQDPSGPSNRSGTSRIFLLLAGLLALLVGLSGLGVRSQSTLFYGFPGVPLMEWQVGLAFALGCGMALLESLRKDRVSPRRLDAGLFVLIWAGALLVWMSQPLQTGGYALPPRAPNQEVYPFSDAMSYDRLARSMAAGFGFMDTKIPPRPLYITFLAGLHRLAGLDYQAIISWQSALLALLPAALYLVGKDLAGRPAGLALSALVILRDVNSNSAESFASNLSYSKMLLSELPTALLLVLFTWLLLRWARRGKPALLEAVLAGGLAGLAVLIRTQSLAVAPLGLLIVLLNRPRAWRAWLTGALGLVLGLVLTISPWLVRNLQVGGGLVFDDPVSQTMVLAQRYNGIAYNAMIERLPAESDSAYTARLMGLALDGLRRDPLGIARGAASHLVNSLADSLRVLPVRTAFASPQELFKPTRPFWETPLDTFAPAQAALLLVILALVTLGVAECWRRARWTGLLPLALNLGYNAWSALFFASGERFILPVDWAILLYFACGLLAAGGMAVGVLRSAHPSWRAWVAGLNDPPPPVPPAGPKTKLWQVGLAALLCLGAGGSIPLAERLIPPAQAPELSRQDRLAILQAAGLDPARLQRLSAQDNTLVLQGLSAYPLYYGAGEGYPGIEKTGYAPAPQPRLVFFILSYNETFALMDLPQAPDFFPDGAEVIALGRQQKGYVQILAALVRKNGRQALWTGSEWETAP